MQIVALRAANNAEIPVPATTLEKAIKFVQRCGTRTSGFGYAGPGRGPQTTPAGILSLQLLGRPDDPRIPERLTTCCRNASAGPVAKVLLLQSLLRDPGDIPGRRQVLERWHPNVRELLLAKQNYDGSWDVPPQTAEARIDPVNKVYSTALATLILNIYMHYLPAYQR